MRARAANQETFPQSLSEVEGGEMWSAKMNFILSTIDLYYLL